MSGPLAFDPIREAGRQWDVHWQSPVTPKVVAVTSVMRAQQIILGRLNGMLDALDLTFPRYEALMILFYSGTGGLPLGKISDRLQVHRASVTNVIDKLVDSGLVERVSHAHDRRTVLAQITPRGRRVARQATKRLNETAFGMAPLDGAACKEIFALLEPLRREAGDFILPSDG